jgi:biofilm PGA synthesis N-glycosyltransferase PgaC
MASWLAAITWFCLGAQAYHYAGYPVLIALLARLRPRPPRTGQALPRVSLIVPAHDEAAVIGRKLENCLAIDYPALQIVVVSDGSTDATPVIIRSFAGQGVIAIEQPTRRGKSVAINRAVAAASGDILVMSDAHALFRDDAIRQLVRNFADPAVGCVSGQLVMRPQPGRETAAGSGQSLYWRYESAIKRLESQVGSCVAMAGMMFAIRRTLFSPLPEGLINDDAYLGLAVVRDGRRAIYEPAAVCWEAPASTIGDEILRRRRITAGRWQLLSGIGAWPWRRPGPLLMLLSHKVLRLILPLLMIGALGANLAAVIAQPRAPLLAATLALQLFFYGLATVGLVAEGTGRHWRIPAAAYYITAGNVGALRGLLAFLRGRQSALWQKAAR